MVKRFTSILLSLIVFNCFSLNDCCSSSKSQSLPYKIKTEICKEAADVKYNFTAAACLLGIMFLLSYQAQVDQMPESLRSQFVPQNLAINFVSTYCMNFASTFFHELGHGLAKKMLVGCDFQIHLGKNSSERTLPIIDFKYFSLDGLDPMAGFNTRLLLNPGASPIGDGSTSSPQSARRSHVGRRLGACQLDGVRPAVPGVATKGEAWEPVEGCEFQKRSTLESDKLVTYTSSQKILINLAGGASGILGYYFLRTFIFFIYNLCEQEDTQILQNLGNALSQAITFDQIVLNQLFNMFIPMQNNNIFGGDAAKIWQELGIKKNIIKSAADVQPYLQMLAFISLSFKQSGSNSTDQRYIADKILIGLVNYFLQGLGQFKSA